MKLIFTTIIAALFISGTASAGISPDQKMFIQLDVDGDGVLTQKEVMSQPAAIRFTNLYSQGSFMLADINKDGFLDLEEYMVNEEDTY